ncbi:hypothetical protein A3K70_00350 [Candidatus Bathyarchaeota archaeon RBG_16_48_13]|nr:MAG: hypothetical protein A3K70_00350 [Candidatus Bathyarchaeota archaeon RBG_16_48_13]
MVVGGAGIVGTNAVGYITHTPGIERVIIADMNESRGAMLANGNTLSTALLGLYPKVEFQKMDLSKEDAVVLILEEKKPKAILNMATMFSSYSYAPLIENRLKELGIRSRLAGHSFAKDFVPIYKLMKAVKKSKIDTRVVNIAFPDHTNPVLGKVGLAPTSGAGTIDLTVEAMKMKIAEKLNAPIHNIQVTFVTHHALRAYPAGDVPYFLRIRLGDEDITKKFDANKLIHESVQATFGQENNAMVTASSGAKITLNILNNTGILGHAPGVKGLPGGYPVRLTWNGPEIILPPDMSMEEAKGLNDVGMKMDGIEKIEDDGTIVFTEPTIRLMKDFLGISWNRMRISEAEKMAQELIAAYKRAGA